MAATGDTSPFRVALKRYLTRGFVENFDRNSKDVLFMFVGGVSGWTADPGPTRATPLDTISDDISAWRGMLGAKKIHPGKVRYLVPRNNWTADTYYAEYDDTDDLWTTEKKFYVVTDEWHVYKCVSNNGGVASERLSPRPRFPLISKRP